jgi:hypothetical protein
LVFQPIQGWVEGTLLNAQGVARDLLYSQKDAIAMLWSERDGFKDE